MSITLSLDLRHVDLARVLSVSALLAPAVVVVAWVVA